MNIRIILWVRRGEGVEASLPPAKGAKEAAGGAGDHPGERTVHLWDGHAVSSWEARPGLLAGQSPRGHHPGCLENWDRERAFAARSPRAATALLPLQALIITLPFLTPTPWTVPLLRFSPSHPHSQRVFSQNKPTHVPCLPRTFQ